MYSASNFDVLFLSHSGHCLETASILVTAQPELLRFYCEFTADN